MLSLLLVYFFLPVSLGTCGCPASFRIEKRGTLTFSEFVLSGSGSLPTASVSQSSTYDSFLTGTWSASYCYDRDTATQCSTNDASNSWWKLDFGSYQCGVSSFQLWITTSSINYAALTSFPNDATVYALNTAGGIVAQWSLASMSQSRGSTFTGQIPSGLINADCGTWYSPSASPALSPTPSPTLSPVATQTASPTGSDTPAEQASQTPSQTRT
jgi:hypothetical protein